MRFLPVNQHSFLLELASLEETLAWYDALCDCPPEGVEEMIPAARTLLIRFSPWQTQAQLVREIARRSVRQQAVRHADCVTIPVRYQGEDLPEVAEFYGISVQALIDRHQQTVWKVAFTGFAPGFAYLAAETGTWQTPRRATPRTRIPQGSVALAAEFSGIYPQASPGGWQLLGQTDCTMWDTHRQPPALLQPGGEVQFVDQREASRCVSLPAMPDQQAQSQQGQSQQRQNQQKQQQSPLVQAALPETAPLSSATLPVAGALSAEQAPALLRVLNPGLHTSWQDGGRAGGAAMGLAPSGAMDKAAWRQANRIVGNPAHWPCLEISQGEFRAQAQQDLVVALTGAPCPLTLVVAQRHYPLAFATPFSMAAGDELIVGAPSRGVRSYLAIRGGCQVDCFLGSAAWDSLARVGTPPLSAGALLLAMRSPQTVTPASSPLTGPARLDAVQPSPEAGCCLLPAPGDTVTLDVLAGPRTDWFTGQALQILLHQPWPVSLQANRSGLRLQGEQALARLQTGELPSEGTCCGAIQVPASGQPVLFLRDHPVTGGYPVIAAVADYHLDLAGQIPPGAIIRFQLIRPFAEIQETVASL